MHALRRLLGLLLFLVFSSSSSSGNILGCILLARVPNVSARHIADHDAAALQFWLAHHTCLPVKVVDEILIHVLSFFELQV